MTAYLLPLLTGGPDYNLSATQCPVKAFTLWMQLQTPHANFHCLLIILTYDKQKPCRTVKCCTL